LSPGHQQPGWPSTRLTRIRQAHLDMYSRAQYWPTLSTNCLPKPYLQGVRIKHSSTSASQFKRQENIRKRRELIFCRERFVNKENRILLVLTNNLIPDPKDRQVQGIFSTKTSIQYPSKSTEHWPSSFGGNALVPLYQS
jgi:hypothetical protein